MDKIIITIDAGKLKKEYAKERSWQNRQTGQTETRRELELEIVPVKQEKVIASGNGQNGPWELRKTHFVALAQSKEERAARAETVFLGEGKMFVSLNEQAPFERPSGLSPVITQEEVNRFRDPIGNQGSTGGPHPQYNM
jgi:hypothetical protein